jgi:hypothetical protein
MVTESIGKPRSEIRARFICDGSPADIRTCDGQLAGHGHHITCPLRCSFCHEPTALVDRFGVIDAELTVLMSDVDINGAHIRTLLLTLLSLYAAVAEGGLHVRRCSVATPRRHHGRAGERAELHQRTSGDWRRSAADWVGDHIHDNFN